jgi:hypothetical protein
VFPVSFSIDVLLFLGSATPILFVCLVGLPATATTTYTVLCQFTSSYSGPVRHGYLDFCCCMPVNRFDRFF